MRIAYVSADRGVAPTGSNGAATHVRELVNALVARAAEVKLLSPRPRRDFDFFTSDMNETPFSIPHELVPRCSLFHVERVFDKLLNEQPSCKVYPLLRIVSKLCFIFIKHRQSP